MSIDTKLRHLKKILKSMKSVVLAYSGGVDSSFLLSVANDCLGDTVLAVTAASETYTKDELLFAKTFCKRFHIRHTIIKTYELNNRNFSANPTNRCYFCKKELFGKLNAIARKSKFNYVVDATNADDMFDFRPGREAKKELGVRSPLVEAKITKKEIRSLSRRFKLPSWNKPQMACLASRIKYGERISAARLDRIEKAECFLRKRMRIDGNIRVRDYGQLARIEVDKKNIPLFLKKDGFVKALKQLGFTYVTVDLEGYRSGSMNSEMSSSRSRKR